MKLNIIFLLLGIIIVSCLLFLVFTNKEGYTDATASASGDDDLFTSLDDDVPGCDSTDSRVPGCYQSVQTDYNDFTSDFLRDDNYILKTQIVTPVCPSDPYTPFESTISENNEDASSNISFSDFSAFLNSKYTKDTSSNIINGSDGSFNIYNNITNTTYKTENISPGEQPKIDPSSISNWTLTNPHTNNLNNANNTTELSDNKYKSETPEAASNIPNNTSQPSTIDESKSTCPPCPSCQRCPDPVVECKRVINYKNPNAASKLPVPIIDDFSNFTK